MDPFYIVRVTEKRIATEDDDGMLFDMYGIIIHVGSQYFKDHHLEKIKRKRVTFTSEN